jgi:repressor LexA
MQRAGDPTPSISEISRHFGFRSTRSARDHLKALERKGIICRNAKKARSIRVLETEDIDTNTISIPFFGSIAAGHPKHSEQNGDNSIHVNSQSIGFKPTPHCFALRVTGESMTGKGIYEGDIVIIDASKEACDGDIVAALIDNETTLKTLVKRGGNNYLKPENTNFPDMLPVNELIIQGVVRTIIRNIC